MVLIILAIPTIEEGTDGGGGGGGEGRRRTDEEGT